MKSKQAFLVFALCLFNWWDSLTHEIMKLYDLMESTKTILSYF